MPRFKRKNHYYSKKKKSPNENGTYVPNSRGGGFSPADKLLLLKYLLDYKCGCERVCLPDDICSSDEETVVTAPAAKSPMKGKDDCTHIEIGQSCFPVLTDHVLAQPYLALPTTLTPRQRKAVHEMCVDGKFKRTDFLATPYILSFSDHALILSSGPVSLRCWTVPR